MGLPFEKEQAASMSVQDRANMYRLIISQLFYDGFSQVAQSLAQAVNAYPACPPSDKLAHVVAQGLKVDEEEKAKEKGTTVAPAQMIDMEHDSDVSVISPEPSTYETVYITSHKGTIRALAFSNDGSLVASGSQDASIKIMDVDRIIQRGYMGIDPAVEGGIEAHPVIRTLYDHVDEVRCLAFHPRMQLLASGGNDYTVKFFDFAKSSVKRAFQTFQEVEPVRCIAFHPTGDYILVGTQHPTLRLYNVGSGQCYVSSVPGDQHHGPICAVSYAPNARLYVTCSKDGDVKLWDGVSNRCVNTFARAHDGAEVCSVRFSKNCKYVLSSGKDSQVKLWELAANRCLIAYTGAGATGKQEYRQDALFNHTEDYVLFPDEKSGSLCSWDARNADRKRLLALGHVALVRGFAHSPTQACFVTSSEDCRARVWYRKTDIE